VDPVFAQPWKHDADGPRLRWALATETNPYSRRWAELDLAVWRWKEAGRRAGPGERERCRQQLLRTIERLRAGQFGLPRSILDLCALEAGDLDGVAADLLAWHQTVETNDLDRDPNSQRRAEARNFVTACIDFLDCRESIGHPQETAVRGAMDDVAARAEDVLMTMHTEGLKRVRRGRASKVEAGRLAAAERSRFPAGGRLTARAGRGIRILPGRPSAGPAEVRDAERVVARARSGRSLEGLPGAVTDLAAALAEPGLDDRTHLRVAVTLANAAVALDEYYDDSSVLVEVADHLSASSRLQSDETATLACLLRARACLGDETMDPTAAARELRSAATSTDDLTRALRPDIQATLARLVIRSEPAAFAAAVEVCRAGREAGLRPGRRATSADLTLARLLISYALEPATDPADGVGHVAEAIRLSRRQSRPWHRGGTAARLVLNAARCARDAATGGLDIPGRRAGWRRAADRAGVAPTADRARLAAAWVAWAVTTEDVDTVAEAYAHLMAIVPLDAASRYLTRAKDKVLAAVQEHTEEAGYWLCRARRYREAVVALETGRAIRLSETIGPDRAGTPEHEPLARFRSALTDLSALERRSGSAGSLRRAWAETRAAAKRVADVTGVDPLALEVGYGDITAVTGDGAVVYLAAAKAGGYALVVAADHDPQFIDLSRLDRATVAGLLDAFRFTANDVDGRISELNGMVRARRWLWDSGLADLVQWHAGGLMVTLIPVGLLSLLPLQAAGAPDDEYGDRRNISDFVVVRYAPNARTLRRCRNTVERLHGEALSLLAADVPDGHGYSTDRHLKHVAAETAEVAGTWAKTGPVVHLHQCGWADFQGAAGDCDVWHLACHGRAYPDDILSSTLLFADRAVTLAELRAELRPALRRLAVLSSCGSHRSGTANPNEVVGLPAALLEIGFAGVIATSWSVEDAPTAYLVTRFYQLWRQDGFPPAVALNLAQQWLRHAAWEDLDAVLPDLPALDWIPRPYEHPFYWAGFTFTGA
jgi:CHAT domain